VTGVQTCALPILGNNTIQQTLSFQKKMFMVAKHLEYDIDAVHYAKINYLSQNFFVLKDNWACTKRGSYYNYKLIEAFK